MSKAREAYNEALANWRNNCGNPNRDEYIAAIDQYRAADDALYEEEVARHAASRKRK